MVAWEILVARPPAPFPAGSVPPRESHTVTTTDIGILLIVQCILLWAIMAALHRHTVQLQALKAEMEALRKIRNHSCDHAAERPAAATRHDNVDEPDADVSRDETARPTQPTFRE